MKDPSFVSNDLSIYTGISKSIGTDIHLATVGRGADTGAG